MGDPLAHMLERTVVIRAYRNAVFRYFTDPARFAAWWGAGSEIDARPGGRVQICYPGGVTAGGEVREVVPDERILFSYGYDDPAKPIARGGSEVAFLLEDHPQGMFLRLIHSVADPDTRDAHLPGWRFQLSLLANAVGRELAAGLPERIDRYFAVWSEPDGQARHQALAALVTDNVVYRDDFAAVAGREDLAAHIGAAQLHLPSVALTREGTPLSCQGTAVVDWVARGPEGEPRWRGRNVIELAPDGRFARVVGLRRLEG
jgi:uncharacterized protein YndB with AHSA1/START domain